MPSIVNEVLKGVIAQYTAANLLTNRETVSLTIKRNLRVRRPATSAHPLPLLAPTHTTNSTQLNPTQLNQERAREFNIVLEDVSITELTFGHEFTAAVEAKQVGTSPNCSSTTKHLHSSSYSHVCPPSPASSLDSTAQQDAERAKFVVEKARQDKRSIIIKAQGEARSAQMIGKAIADNPGFVELRRIEAAQEIARVMARSTNRVYLPADTLLMNIMAHEVKATGGAGGGAGAGSKKA